MAQRDTKRVQIEKIKEVSHKTATGGNVSQITDSSPSNPKTGKKSTPYDEELGKKIAKLVK